MSVIVGSALIALLAFASTLAITPAVRRAAIACGAVARGGGRHVHQRPVPRWGGVALAIGLTCGLVGGGALGADVGAELERFGWPVAWWIAGAAVVLACGTLDDLIALPAHIKLSFQLAAAVLAVLGGFGFHAFSNPFTGGVFELGHLGPLLSILWIVGLTNAFNLVDGLDGLAAGLALIASITLIAVSVLGERPDAVYVFALFAGGLLGFLRYNFNPASIFLGDSGSLLIGYLLAVASVQSLQKGAVVAIFTVPVLTFGLPILETGVTVARRFLVAGLAAVFRADRDHIHHRLIAGGLTHRRAVMLLYAAAAALGASAFLTVATRGSLDVVIVALVAAAIAWAGRRLGYHRAAAAVASPSHAAAPSPRLAVVVLGDLGRSPRITYHAWAAAESGFDVDLIGEVATPLLKRIADHPRVQLHAIELAPRARTAGESRWRFLLLAGRQAGRQTAALWRTFHALPVLDTILVQTPPSIPTLALAAAVARQRDARLVFDWHNFGFAMLARRLPPDHILVRFARSYEWRVARHADAHLCVSAAMAGELRRHRHIDNVRVLYDRAAPQIAPCPPADKPRLRHELAKLDGCSRLALSETRLAVSPTSFTVDEDLGLLFDALERYDQLARARAPQAAHLMVVLSGQGELRDTWQRRALALQATQVSVAFVWLSAERYPDLLAAADLGISVHRSTSGLDLPMKVVDLHGAGVPVCAFDYGPCLREQIDDGVTGILFRSADELAGALFDLLSEAEPNGKLAAMAHALRSRRHPSFIDEWRRVVPAAIENAARATLRM